MPRRVSYAALTPAWLPAWSSMSIQSWYSLSVIAWTRTSVLSRSRRCGVDDPTVSRSAWGKACWTPRAGSTRARGRVRAAARASARCWASSAAASAAQISSHGRGAVVFARGVLVVFQEQFAEVSLRGAQVRYGAQAALGESSGQFGAEADGEDVGAVAPGYGGCGL